MTELHLDCEEAFPEVEKALAAFVKADVPLSAELLFVDESEIQTLNREQRKIDRVTDVLSFPTLDGIRGKALKKRNFPYDIDEAGRLFLGSIVICKKRAAEQAEEYGHSYRRELHYLIVHGLLHLLGYDHMTDEDKAQMREQEEKVLSSMGIVREA